MKKRHKNLVRAALAGLILTGSAALVDLAHAEDAPAAAAPATGECHGVNECKGTGACGGEGHSCSGKNECKGKGWLKMSKEDCEAKGGTFKEGK